LEDRYCPCCGQDRFAGLQRSFIQVVIDICSNIFTFDDKAWVTVGKLLFRPGFLSKEYISGRIVPYMQPIKMFWIMVLIFTIVFSFLDHTTTVVLTPIEVKSSQHPTETIQNENINNGEDISVEEVVIKEPEVQKGVVSDYFQYLPYFMLLVIPVFTAFLALFFRKEKYAFSDHLIFAIHLHTVFFFVFTMNILVAAYLYHITPVFFLIICLYALLAAIKFYHTRRKRNVIWRMLFIGLLYSIVMAAVFILLLLTLSWIFNTNISIDIQ